MSLLVFRKCNFKQYGAIPFYSNKRKCSFKYKILKKLAISKTGHCALEELNIVFPAY